jgi:hypothetical protein
MLRTIGICVLLILRRIPQILPEAYLDTMLSSLRRQPLQLLIHISSHDHRTLVPQLFGHLLNDTFCDALVGDD